LVPPFTQAKRAPGSGRHAPTSRPSV
jgi:hypothetical protein